MLLYRHMDRQFVESFKEHGLLRICPVRQYRTDCGIRQDSTEGIVSVTSDAILEISASQSKAALGMETNFVQTGGTITWNYQLPDGYLLCASTKCTSDVAARFGTDAYFTIFNIHVFGEALRRAISITHEVQHTVGNIVTYATQKTLLYGTQEELLQAKPSNRSIDDYFIKTEDYAPEWEYRFVFILAPNCKADGPIFLQFTKDEVWESCSFPTFH